MDEPDTSLKHEEDLFYPLKRKIYLAILPITIVATLVSWVITDFGKDEDLYGKLILPGFATWMVLWFAVLLWRRAGFRAAELGIFWGSVFLLVVNLYRNLGELSYSGIWQPDLWMGILFPMAHIVFNPREALRISFFIYLLYVAIGLGVIIPQFRAGETIDWNTIIHIYASQMAYFLMTRLVLGLKEQLTRLRLEAAKFYQMAHTDPLTGIDNRRSMMAALRNELERRKTTGQAVSLILLDLDNFKQINDRHGHEMGDRVLTHVANLLRQNLRASDRVGRWGGEEFVLLLPETPLGDAQVLAERLQKALMENPLEDLRPISASFGVATTTPEDTPDTLVSKADTAMYASKQAGGNRVRVA